MSRHEVIRNGLGPLHIAERNSIDWEALCGSHFTGPNVKTWRAGRQATAVWGEWKHCHKCETRDRELAGK